MKTNNTNRKKYYLNSNHCIDCGKEICSVSLRCIHCFNKKQIGRKLSEETRRKISVARRDESLYVCPVCGGEKSWGSVVCRKCHHKQLSFNPVNRKAMTGSSPLKGIPRPDEVKKKISEKLKGNIPWNKGRKTDKPPWNKGLTKETSKAVAKYVENSSKTRKGKKRPFNFNNLELRKKMSDIKKGDKNPAKRPEVKEKIRSSVLQMYEKHPEILENRKRSGLNQFSGGFTDIERMIAEELRLKNIGFVHNRRVGRYFADFLIFDRVIIECDGEYWHQDKEKESRRNKYLYDRGYFIFHLDEKRIRDDPKECVKSTVCIAQDLLKWPPYPKGAGQIKREASIQ